MSQKQDYIIWREKNGFFTALDKASNLFTWTLTTGKLLYNEPQTKDAEQQNIIDYEVYGADPKDISYTTNFHNQEDYTISLIKSRAPMSHMLVDNHPGFFNLDYAMSKIDRQLEKNKAGLVNVDSKVKPLGNDFLKVENEKMPIKILNSQ